MVRYPASPRAWATGISSCPVWTPSGAELPGELRKVIDDQRNAGALRERVHLLREPPDILRHEFLRAQLQDIDAALQHLRRDFRELRGSDVGEIQDAVKAAMFEAFQREEGAPDSGDGEAPCQDGM